MKMNRQCLKCGINFITEESIHKIDGKLCIECANKWHIFFKLNQRRLEDKYPRYMQTHKRHVTYDVYMGYFKDKDVFIFR